MTDFLAPHQHPYAPDHIEMEWQSYSDARDFMQEHLPQVLERFSNLQRILHEREYGIDQQLLQSACEISIICLVRFALRHGALSEMPLAYHNEIHCLEVLENLLLIPAEQTRQLHPVAWILLIIFAASHDLHQGLLGQDSRGIGRNELASADEVQRLIVSHEADLDFSSQQLIQWMIYGSTFAIVPATYRGQTIDSGSLSPLIAKKIMETNQSFTDFSTKDAAQMVLLATDIDTGNVARPFEELVLQSARLCREIYTKKGLSLETPDSVGFVLDFMRNGQRKYFFYHQKFHSRFADGLLREKSSRMAQS